MMNLKKKLLTALTSCLMLGNLAVMMPVSAADAVEGTYNGLTYEIYENNYIVITDCDPSLTTVEVPAEINGVEVTKIGESAFALCRDLTSVTLPETIIGIMDFAFDGCSSLETLQIPARTSEISNYAFSYVSGLKNITVADGSTSFKTVDGVLMEYDGTTIVCYPPKKADTSYTIPDGVEDAFISAFSLCMNLTEVTLPDSFTKYDLNFDSCLNLDYVTVGESNSNFKSEEGILYSKDGSVLYYYPPCKEGTSYVIPDGTTEIAPSAFDGNSFLVTVTVPDSLSTIGTFAFADCHKLQSISLPDSMDSIGADAFSFCYDLTDIKLPSTVKTFSASIFSYCRSLTTVKLPENITRIEWGMFSNCESLTSIEIPINVSKIDNYAFNNCTGLTDVYYADSEEKWNTLKIGYNNDALLNATKHFGASDTPDTPDSASLGDISGDGQVNASDAARILMAAAALGSGADSGFTDAQKANADLNKDGVFDSIDASLILQYAAYTGSGGTMSLTDYLASL